MASVRTEFMSRPWSREPLTLITAQSPVSLSKTALAETLACLHNLLPREREKVGRELDSSCVTLSKPLNLHPWPLILKGSQNAL